MADWLDRTQISVRQANDAIQAAVAIIRQELRRDLKAEYDRAEALLQENIRLRAALQKIADETDEESCCGHGATGPDGSPECCCQPERGFERVLAIARQALCTL